MLNKNFGLFFRNKSFYLYVTQILRDNVTEKKLSLKFKM